ncbi:PREDICTED: exonuclease 1 [Gekko japonicus]|uniref:Exonuclease 1 n=1 Tax=Gekko japonicus TaxID=146911 RepID=A0ABM1L270_GEKJA|nr:PREDICTED: exonuclease 1 [Gekko japonicus]
MGIPGLLQFIKEAADPTHIKKYKGQVVAVDTYCWLHKGAYACAEKLARAEPTDQYVIYCMKLVDMLLSFGVKPVLVFDGCTLPSKMEVEKSRREKRQANLLKGKQLLREGKLSEARERFARSINVTHAMACEVIKAARAKGIDCIVAPYEADAQLAYLNKTGIVQAIITEDSDLLAFGCKKVFLKLDKFGNGLEVDQARLGMCKQLGDVFTEEKFRYMCILSGCDYLPSIHGIGLSKACKLLKIANNPDIIKVIGRIGQYLKMNISVPKEYIEGFIRANNTFLYQLVFDPVRRKLVPLNAYSDDVDPEMLLYAGKHVGDSTAFQIALGNKDLNTLKQIDDYNPDVSKSVQPRSCSWDDKPLGEKPSNFRSIWSRDYKPGFAAEVVPDSAPLLERPPTKGTERLINTKGLKLPHKAMLAKRQRHEEQSDGDLLSQYSFSNSKKPKTEKGEDIKRRAVDSAVIPVPVSVDPSSNKETSNSRPRLRNKFAFLRKKEEGSHVVVVPGTRSRFFCSIMDAPDDIPKDEVHQPSQKSEVDCQTMKAESAEAKDCSSISLGTVETGRADSPSLRAAQTSCFSWSRSFAERSGTPSPTQNVALLKQFHRHTSGKTASQDCKMSGSQMLSSTFGGKESDEESSLLKGLGCSSEQKSNELSQSNLDCLENSPVPSEKTTDAKESACSSEPDCNLKCQISPFFESLHTEKDTVFGTLVFGLHKTSPVRSCVVTKCKSLMPAKVSGLSKRIANTKKKNHHNAENKSGQQVTINELWKSFQFRRQSERLPSCKKPEPLSPIKDNIQLTPDTDDDTFNKLEFSHVQRKIFQ